jgi:hypothetical protein
MGRLLIAMLVALGAVGSGCNSPESEVRRATAGEVDPPPILDVPPGRDFGAGLTLGEVADFQDVIGHPEKYADRSVLLRAPIQDVCQKKGCWMILAEGDAQVRVRFKDYDFFVPKDAAGKLAYVEGRVKAELVSEKTARHYAEESQREDPSRIRGPQKAVSFVATGVRIVASE